MKPVWVVGNGPSAESFVGVPLAPSIGCNRAFQDFELDHLVVVDRFCIAELRGEGAVDQGLFSRWTRKSSLELPPGWQEFRAPGTDSGTAAIQLAVDLYPTRDIVCIGFDGVLHNNVANRYTYSFRGKSTPRQSNAAKHRSSIQDLIAQNDIAHKVWFASDTPSNPLQTIRIKDAIQMARA